MIQEVNQLNFERGLTKAVGTLENIRRRPILAAVYGWPGNGKSYLIDKIAEHFRKRNFDVANYGVAPSKQTFQGIKDRKQGNCIGLYLFHCAWDRENPIIFSVDEDPNHLASRILGRNLDLNIGIYNSNSKVSELKGNYDILISNSIGAPSLR